MPVEIATPRQSAAEPPLFGGRWRATSPRRMHQRGPTRLWEVRDTTGEHQGLAVLKTLVDPSRISRERFLREAKTTQRLSQTVSGVVPVLDVGTIDGGEPYFVMLRAEMTLMRARDLFDQPERVLQIGVTLAETLSSAHAEGIIHRDIKPENVLLFGDSRTPVLSDFGICYDLEAERLTGDAGETLGTEHFVAPELLGGGQRVPTVQSDVYSLGKTLYAALRGRPFPREEHRGTGWDLATLRKDRRYEHLHGLLDRMTTAGPSDRFSSMGEVASQLQRAIENVRRDVPFVPGMYGGARVPYERYLRHQQLLAGTQGISRADILLDAVEEGVRSAREHVKSTHIGPGDPFEYSMADPSDQEVAAVCGEHLLVAGALLVISGEEEMFEEWHTRMIRLLEEPGPRSRGGMVLATAALYAIYAAAALAWRRRRWAHLGHVTRAFVDHWRSHIYLNLLDRNAKVVGNWIVDRLRASVILKSAAPEIAVAAADMVGLISGLALIRHLAGLDQTAHGKIVGAVFRGEGPGFPDYPALYGETFGWIETLADTALTSAAVSRGLEEVIPAARTGGVTGTCAVVTAPLFSLISAKQPNRDINAAVDLEQGRWGRWVNRAGELGAGRPPTGGN